MALYFVRHAKAGDRSSWNDADELRPLSTAGWKQAIRIAERLAEIEPTRLVSSPYVRCAQTLEPLASRTGLDVELDERLREGAPFEGALALLDELPDQAVLCSHGDLIPDTMAALVRRGLDLRSTPDWRKASVWVIRRSRSGRYPSATVWPPPGR